MTETSFIISWMCQLYLAFFFLRSAYRKTINFEKVSVEFQGWGYPFPGFITRLLSLVWVICGIALLVPATSWLAAVVLMAFMIVACATLVWHREFRRLIEPAVPMLLLAIVIWVRRQDAIILFAG